jgi:hypothetical protein
VSVCGFRQGEVFFFVNKKETKKTSLVWARAGDKARALSEQKFFASFLQKRSTSFSPLPSFAASHPVPKGI